MASQLDIVNRSLLQIGARAQVSSINPSDGSTEGDACSVLYTPTFESLGRAAHWNCLRKQAVLSLLAAAQGTPENPSGTLLPLPPTPWLYEYEYPADCLQMRFLVPSFPATGSQIPPTSAVQFAQTYLPGLVAIPYQVAYATDPQGNPIITILTNQSQSQAVYTVNQPNPVIWDSQFQQAMVLSLSAFLVPALSLHLPLMQASVTMAEKMIMEARRTDGNEGTPVQDHTPDWIRARAGEGGWLNPLLCNGSAFAYADMSWPGG